MKKFLKNDIYIIITLFFVVLIFKNNILFKETIISGCKVFFLSVLPTLLPMFIINDILMNYNFIYYLNKIFQKIFFKLFSFSSSATYIFIMSILSGTPTNAYIATNLVNNKELSSKDASIILSYSFFLNPLFLFSMLTSILNSPKYALKIILIYYLANFLIALYFRKYNYTENTNLTIHTPEAFSKVLTKSITKSFATLTNVLGTIIFYFIICEGINIFIKNPLFNCITNGLLEVTGGLAKLSTLNINFKLKEVISIIFISFGGLSIHSQIKSIIYDANISYKYFFIARLFHVLISILLITFT